MPILYDFLIRLTTLASAFKPEAMTTRQFDMAHLGAHFPSSGPICGVSVLTP